MKGFVTVSIMIFSCLMLLAACGKNKTDSSDSSQGSSQNSLDTTGDYRIVFQPLNLAAGNHNAIGTATLDFTGEEADKLINITVSMVGLPSGVRHMQYLHQGSKCPDIDLDANQDGFVDHVEGLPAHGANLVALDGDISSQDPVGARFPQGSAYTYHEGAGVLSLPETFGLEGRTVVIYGTSSKIPESVAAMEGMSREASLPVACGSIVRVLEE